MKTGTSERLKDPVDEFWTEHNQLFIATLPTHFSKPHKVWGRFHTVEEQYDENHEIIPLTEKKGNRTYIMMQPYVLEPNMFLSVELYNKPKKYADQDSEVGKVTGSFSESLREIQLGNSQAWYYPHDKMLVIWECFFDQSIRTHPLAKDGNMITLWLSFENWLKKQFPDAQTIATPFNDPIAHSIEEYQAFLHKLGYSPLSQAAFGKSIG